MIRTRTSNVFEFLTFFLVSQIVKSVRIRSSSGPYFPAFGLNMERYLDLSACTPNPGKKRTRITPNTDTFFLLVSKHLVEAGGIEKK